MTAAEVLEDMKEASWANTKDLEENLNLAECYLGLRSRGAAEDVHLEKAARRGLRRCVGKLKQRVQEAKAELRELGPRVTKLTTGVEAAKREIRNSLWAMAEGQLNRVGAPKVSLRDPSLSQDLMKDVVMLGAPAEAFNALYETLPEGKEEWTCTEAAAASPEQDLLGMCPGGKPHLNEEQLMARKEKFCYCSLCVPERKMKDRKEELEKIRPRMIELRAIVREDQTNLRVAKYTISRLRSEEDEDEELGIGDPVFYDEDRPYEAGNNEVANASHSRAQQTWDMLQRTLKVSDFPLRLVFLDKSGSMGCDAVTYDALQLGLQNCLNPTSGSTLTFLFAGPGDTQIFFRRPGDEPIQVSIELGCATWFNEPILRTLKILAPLVEQLNTKEWMKQFGQPPLQVLCMTDGADNCSPNEIRSLAGLIRELKEIVGPESEEKLYVPITGSLKKHKEFTEDEELQQVPVWMAWICCGMGGSQIMDSKAPKELCMIDAIAAPQYREPPAIKDIQAPEPHDPLADDDDTMHSLSSTVASRARKRMSKGSLSNLGADWVSSSNASWGVGHRVRVRAAVPGKAPKAAMVLHVHQREAEPPQYEVLYDDETRSMVDASQLLGAPPKRETLLCLPKHAPRPKGCQAKSGILARTADQDEQRLQVLQVVDTVMQDLATIMHSKEEKAKKISLEDASAWGAKKGGSDLEEKLLQARRTVEVEAQEQIPPVDPTDAVLMAINELGRGSAKILPEDRPVAQRIVSVGMEMLMSGGSVMPAHTSDQLGPFAGLTEANRARRIRIEPGEMDAWREELTQPVKELLNVLLRKGLLDCARTADGEVWSATQDGLGCLAAIWRFVDPSLSSAGQEDALRRAVNRMQRLKPSFSFIRPSTTSDLGAMVGNASSPLAVEDREAPCSRRSSRGGLPPLSPGSRVSTPDSAAKTSASPLKPPPSPARPISRGSIGSASTTASGSSGLNGFIRKASGVAKNRTSSLTAIGGRMLLADESQVSTPSSRPGSARQSRALSLPKRQSTLR